MHMRVDPAGQDQQPRGVDPLGPGQPLPNLGDAPVANADIGGIAVGGGHDRAARDDQVQPAHATIRASASVRRST